MSNLQNIFYHFFYLYIINMSVPFIFKLNLIHKNLFYFFIRIYAQLTKGKLVCFLTQKINQNVYLHIISINMLKLSFYFARINAYLRSGWHWRFLHRFSSASKIHFSAHTILSRCRYTLYNCAKCGRLSTHHSPFCY